MDFIDRVQQLAAKAKQMRQMLQGIDTEEATKNALVMPFIQTVLEYDVFNPSEVVPELTADVGTKKGEKVDYAILKDGKAVILFECKKIGAPLDKEQASQLFRYFTVTEARFGVLTDGIIYRFFTDLEKPHLMDTKPFLEINLVDLDESLVDELRKFTKSSFEVDGILATASELKYSREIRKILSDLLAAPTDDFIKFVASQVYSGKMMQSVIQQFRPITKNAFGQFINDKVNERLKTALIQEPSTSSETQGEIAVVTSDDPPAIVTTEEEIRGFFAVKAIASQVVDPKRIFLRDHKRSCSVLLDDSIRKPIARFYFGDSSKKFAMFDENKNEQITAIGDVDDIFAFSSEIRLTVQRYLTLGG